VRDAGGPERWSPLARPELLEVDVAAACGREEQLRVEPDRHPFEHVDDALAKRHAAPLAARLRAGQIKGSRVVSGQVGTRLVRRETRSSTAIRTAVKVGQIFDIGHPFVRAHPERFEFPLRDVTIEDVERMSEE
jgi:hypothetical protein